MTVTTAAGLRDALASSGANGTIIVEPGSSINVDGVSFPDLPDGIRIVSGTGAADRPAATIEATTPPPDHVFEAYGSAEIRGLAFSGYENRVIPLDRATTPAPLFLHGPEATVSGCSFDGWPYAGLVLGSKGAETQALVANCSFTNHLMRGYGYGVFQYNGHMEIDRCFLDRCRHGVTSFGRPSCSYELHHTVFGEHFLSHAADMHGLAENVDTDDPVAGGQIDIHHCEFNFTHDMEGDPQEAIKIRGVPAEGAHFWDCSFLHPDPPVEPGSEGAAFYQEHVDRWTNLRFENLVYGGAPVPGDPPIGLLEPDSDDPPGDGGDGGSQPSRSGLALVAGAVAVAYLASKSGD